MIKTACIGLYSLSLHDALPILAGPGGFDRGRDFLRIGAISGAEDTAAFLVRLLKEFPPRVPDPQTNDRPGVERSEEHTSELQSRLHLVCRLLLEKKKKYHGAFK